MKIYSEDSKLLQSAGDIKKFCLMLQKGVKLFYQKRKNFAAT